jgi:uncharacterized RDD family membrane protein YckC
MIDTLHTVDTPEGIELELRVAGPVARSLAYAVDLLLSTVLLLAGSLLLVALGPAGTGLYLILAFAIYWFLPVIFEIRADGQTPGKRLMGLRVVDRDGRPVTAGASITRNLLRVVDFLPFFWLTGLLAMGIDRSFRRLGDLAAGTLVVYAAPEAAVRFEIGTVTPEPPPLPLEPAEERAVIAFAERASLLTPERADELAAIAAPLVGSRDARQQLLRMAAWIVGTAR